MQGYYCNVHFRSHRAFASTINDRQACWLPKGRTVATRQSIETGALFPPVPGHAASRRAGNKICKPRGAGGRQPQLSPPPPPQRAGTQTPSLTWKGSPFILQCCASMLQKQRCPRREVPRLLQVKPSALAAAARALSKGI